MAQALTGYVTQPRTGVSLVTCCKNRNLNLVKAIPSWLALPEISEIVIVDWCSDEPVVQSLAQAGIKDERIRVFRVEEEPRWILSYAFNVGFRVARYDRILKADADIILSPAFFTDNTLRPGTFIAGNWRTADPGQTYVNGFFLIGRADLMAINGFNEYITTYGWDDDDLYERLVASGCTRIDVAAGSVHHQDHDDMQRVDDQPQSAQSGWDDLKAQTMFKIRINRFIATIMPSWNADRIMQPYTVATGTADQGDYLLQRAGGSLHVVPDHIAAKAHQLAAYELVSWRAGLRVFELTDAQLDLLLSCLRLEALTPLHVELTLAEAPLNIVLAPRILVVDLQEEALAGLSEEGQARLWAHLAVAQEGGRKLVMRAAQAAGPLKGLPQAADLPFLPIYYNIGPSEDVALDALGGRGQSPVQHVHVTRSGLLALNEGTRIYGLVSVPKSEAAPKREAAPDPLSQPAVQGDAGSAPASVPSVPDPAVIPHRARLFIDAQHGLGNRLRAFGSAAAIARATDRELVVIWAPDMHCDGRFEDLFDYDGCVLDAPFIEDAQAKGMSVLNYMEIEAGATKDAPLVLVQDRDAYIRSAYIVSHPASTWESENVALRRLRPTAEVRDLMQTVPDHRDIAAHVRMEGAPGTETKPYDSIENWTEEGHAAIQDWRSKSHYSHFVKRLDTLCKERPEAKIFLAADQPETYAAFAEIYGARVAGLQREVFDRSARQLQYALADILLLARCRHFLGSNWSSFSEVAQRLSTTHETTELAGVDF